MYDTQGILIISRYFIQQNSLFSNRRYNTENLLNRDSTLSNFTFTKYEL